MDFRSPAYITDAVIARTAHGIFGYSRIPGRYFKAVLGWLDRRHGIKAGIENIQYGGSVVLAINEMVKTFSCPGDKIIIQTPVYYPFYSVVRDNNRIISENKLVEDDLCYSMDLDDLEKKLRDPLTKMMIICNPHNPVGRVWTREELENVCELCIRNDVLLISDEIHSDIVYGENKHCSLFNMENMSGNGGLILFSPSKTFNIPSLASCVVLTKNKEAADKFKKSYDKGHHLPVNPITIEAAIAAYTHGDEWTDSLVEYLDENRSVISAHLDNSSVGYIKPQGTYLAWLDFRKSGIEKSHINKFIASEAGVGLSDGIDFGDAGAGFQRLNFGCPKKKLEEGLARIVDILPGGGT